MTSPVIPLQPVRAAPSGAAGPTPAPGRGWPLLRLGFRPFYLGAAALAVLAVPLWVAVLMGWLALPGAVPPLLWHAHEMLFGFAAAVIVGFLLTAGKAWTGLATPRGPVLGGLVLLWLAARLAALMAPYAVYAALDVLLLPLVAGLLAAVLLRAGNRRNLPLPLMLLLMAGANALFHAAMLGWVSLSPLTPLHAGLALVVMIECVMAGRVLPAFTMSATPGLKLAAQPRLAPASAAVTASALLAWVLLPAGPLPALLLGAAALLHAARLWRWQPGVTRGRPILWILHASYAWLPVGFALLALAAAGLLPTTAGVHALAVGATGGLIIGMVTRTARGHTGRPLRASRAEVLAYALVMAAALLRTLVPLLVAPPAPLLAAALAWSAAFGIYLWTFTPWLLRPRLDGKDG